MMNCELRQLNTFIKSCSTSNAAIKNTASPIPKEGWYPAYSASGQDVWLPEYRYSGKGIVVSAVGARCGKCFQADGKWNVTANTHVLLVDESIADYKYCWYLLNDENWWIKSGSGQPFVKVKDSLNRSILLPDLSTQQNIATILDKISEGIALCRKMMDELDLMVKAKFREMLETDYSEKTATEVCTAIVDCPHSTPTYSGCELLYPAIRTSEISNGEINWNSMKYVSADEYRMRVKKLMPQPGDIVYAREGTYGDCVILPAGFSFCLGQRTMLFRPNIDIVNPIYLHQVLRSNYVKRQADKSNTGSTVPHVNVADAKQFHFPLPPIEVQNRFADFSTKINESKLTIRGILDKMETEKLALMQEYFG